MKDDMRAARHHQRQGDINKLITPEMRQQIRGLKDRLDGSDYRLFELLDNIQEALDIARQSARCLLTNDPFKAWEKIRSEDEWDTLFDRSAAERRDAKRNPWEKFNIEKLTTSQMRRQIAEAKKRLEEYAVALASFLTM